MHFDINKNAAVADVACTSTDAIVGKKQAPKRGGNNAMQKAKVYLFNSLRGTKLQANKATKKTGISTRAVCE